ncbi:hypothetical protein ACOMHN_025759 [Nucella lapillus]
MAGSDSKQAQGRSSLSWSPEDESDDHNAAECGIDSCKPTVFRMCATIPVFTGVYSFSAVTTSTLSVYVNSQVTTLERHFGFSSAQTGLIMAANDVGFLVVILFVSFLAAHAHIPRALGLCTVLFGVSGVLCALPQFLYGAPSPPPASSGNSSALAAGTPSGRFRGQMCDGVSHVSFNCSAVVEDSQDQLGQGAGSGDASRANSGTALLILVAGMVLQGVSKTPRASFTTYYVDSNVPNVKTGFYMGVIIAVGILGPALAFALGGVFARMYVTLEDTDLHFRHPRWIGAWWLGYLTFGTAACVLALPLVCFPRRIQADRQGGLQALRPQADSATVLSRWTQFVKGFLQSLRRLLVNPVYVCTVLSACAMVFVAGGQSFSAKYTENQFALPAWSANMAHAGMALGSASLGALAGGYMTQRWRMGPMASVKCVLATTVCCTAFTSLVVLFGCQQPLIYNSPGPRASAETSVEGCVEGCGCDDQDYFPVCGGDGRTFFSPCHAGCRVAAHGNYANCTCIEGGTAIGGMCDYSCSMFYPYIVIYCIAILFNTVAVVPTLLVYIRSVTARWLGWMLAPIFFGKLIDGSCIQWEQSCSGGGACLLYDNDKFRLKFLGLQSIFRGVSLLFSTLAYIAARSTRTLERNAATPVEAHA